MGLRPICLAALPLLSIGCINSSNNPDLSFDGGAFEYDAGFPFDGAAPDTSTAPAPDATVPDASVPDSAPAPDAPPPVDAGPPGVTLDIVDQSGNPEAGIVVVFSDASGAVLTSVTTGASGIVSEVVPAGSQVTVLFGSASSPALVTIVAVAPGDKLTVADTTTGVNEFSQGLTVTDLPGSPLDGGGNFTVHAGSCNGSAAAAPIPFALTESCVAGGKFPLLAEENNVNGQVIAFAVQKGNALATDGGLDDSGAQEVSMSGATWAPSGLYPISIANIPDDTFVSLVFDEVSGGVSYPNLGRVLDVQNGVGQSQFVFHPGYADFVQLETSYQPRVQTTGSVNGTPYVVTATRASNPSAAGASVNLSSSLPALTSTVLDYSDVARPSVGWSTSAPQTSADGAVVIVSWFVDSNISQAGSWTFVAPPSMSLLKAPALPSYVAAWAPATGAEFDVPTAILADGTYWAGYDAFKTTAATFAAGVNSTLTTCMQGSTDTACIPPLPVDGTVRITAFTPEAG